MRITLPFVLSLAACDTYLAPPEGDAQALYSIQSTQQAIQLENCSDGEDNDGDGDVDMEDRDCKVAVWRSKMGYTLGIDVEYGVDGDDLWPTLDLVLRSGDFGDLYVYYNPEGEEGRYGQTELYDERKNLVGVIHHMDAEAVAVDLVVVEGDKQESLVITTETGTFWIPELRGGAWSTEAIKWED